MGNKTDFGSILLLNEKPLCIFNIVVESFQVRHRLLFEILKLTTEVNVVVPFEQDGQVLFLDYSEANIFAFKQLDSPIHVVTFGHAITFPHLFKSTEELCRAFLTRALVENLNYA